MYTYTIIVTAPDGSHVKTVVTKRAYLATTLLQSMDPQ